MPECIERSWLLKFTLNSISDAFVECDLSKFTVGDGSLSDG